MLRETPAFSPPVPDSIMPSNESDDFEPTTGALDDIFGSAPTSPSQAPILRSENINGNGRVEPLNLPARNANSERSDIPRLRSTHVTSGYRDGIAESKAKFVQEGFDEGFSLGAVIGLKAGWLVGVLEGVVRAVNSDASASDDAKGQARAEFVKAKEELELRSLFAREYFGEDGIWIFEVEGESEGGDVTFREVATAHPVVRRWSERVVEVQKKFGLDFVAKARPEQEGDEGKDL